MQQTPHIIKKLLGCSLLEIRRSYWAVKLDKESGHEWVCEARFVHDWRKGEERHIDWMDDIVATGDCTRIKELWLLCPPSSISPLGNTARLPIEREASAFQLKIATHDAPIGGPGTRTQQAHIIGRIENEAGDCTCFVYDPVQGGLLTPETQLYDPTTGHITTNEDGTPFYPLRTNVRHFGWRFANQQKIAAMWRPSLAPLGELAVDRLGVRL